MLPPAKTPVTRTGGPRSDYAHTDHVFMRSQPSWQKRVARLRGLRHRSSSAAAVLLPTSPSAQARDAPHLTTSQSPPASDPSSPTHHDSGLASSRPHDPGFLGDDESVLDELLGVANNSHAAVPDTGMALVLRNLDATTASVLRGHMPAPGHGRQSSMASSMSASELGTGGTGQVGTGLVFPSPFELPTDQAVPKSSKGLKARQTWLGIHKAFGQEATAPQLATALQAARSEDERRAFDHQQRRKAARDARALAEEVALETGDMTQLRTAYDLSRLHKSQRTFDQEWMTAAYDDGGSRDAITNYAPVPLADRIAQRTASTGASKLELLQNIVGIDHGAMEDHKRMPVCWCRFYLFIFLFLFLLLICCGACAVGAHPHRPCGVCPPQAPGCPSC